MSDHKEYISKLVRDIQIRQERTKMHDDINANLYRICRELDGFNPKIMEAENKGTDLSSEDKARLDTLNKEYNEQFEIFRKLLAGEQFREGDYPIYHKSSPIKMVLKKLNIDGHSALCTWIDANRIDIEREFEFTELTKVMPV